jgi:superfamily II DNA/RNA helicase
VAGVSAFAATRVFVARHFLRQDNPLIQTIADALATQGYDSLTPVQEAVTNPDLVEADLLVSAQTGSGKTVAFGLAIAPTLLGDDEKFGHAGAPLALIIAPTRELAMQVSRELTWLYGKAGAVVTTCVGGMDTTDARADPPAPPGSTSTGAARRLPTGSPSGG